MVGKSKIDVLNVTSKSKLDEAISEYVTAHRYYQRLIAMKIIAEGNTTNEAIENGLKQLKVSKDKVEIKVLENENKKNKKEKRIQWKNI